MTSIIYPNIKIDNNHNIESEYIDLYILLRNIYNRIFRYYDLNKEKYIFLNNNQTKFILEVLKRNNTIYPYQGGSINKIEFYKKSIKKNQSLVSFSKNKNIKNTQKRFTKSKVLQSKLLKQQAGSKLGISKSNIYPSKSSFALPFTNIIIGYNNLTEKNPYFNLFIRKKYEKIWQTLYFDIPSNFFQYFKNSREYSNHFKSLDIKDFEEIYKNCIEKILEGYTNSNLLSKIQKYSLEWYKELELKDGTTYTNNQLLEKLKENISLTNKDTKITYNEYDEDSININKILGETSNSLNLYEPDHKIEIIRQIYSIAFKDIIIYIEISSNVSEFGFIDFLLKIVNKDKNKIFNPILSSKDIDILKEYYYRYILSIIKNQSYLPIILKPIKRKLYDFYNRTKGFPKNNDEFNNDLKKIIRSITYLNFEENSLKDFFFKEESPEKSLYLEQKININDFNPDYKETNNIEIDTLEMLKINILLIFNSYKKSQESYINNTPKIIERIDIIRNLIIECRFPNKNFAINYLYEKSSNIKNINDFDNIFESLKENLHELFNNETKNGKIFRLLKEYIKIIKSISNKNKHGGKHHSMKKNIKKTFKKKNNSFKKKLTCNRSTNILSVGGSWNESTGRGLKKKISKGLKDIFSKPKSYLTEKATKMGELISEPIDRLKKNLTKKATEIGDSISEPIKETIKNSKQLIQQSSDIIKKKATEIDDLTANYIGKISTNFDWDDFKEFIYHLYHNNPQVYSEEISPSNIIYNFVIMFEKSNKYFVDDKNLNILEKLSIYLNKHNSQNNSDMYYYLFSFLKLIHLFNLSYPDTDKSNDHKMLVFLKEIELILNFLLNNNVERYLLKEETKLKIRHLLADYIYDIYIKQYFNNKEFTNSRVRKFLKLEVKDGIIYPLADKPKLTEYAFTSTDSEKLKTKIENQENDFNSLNQKVKLNKSPKINLINNINGDTESVEVSSLINTVIIPSYTDIGQYFSDLKDEKITKEQHYELFDYIEDKFNEAKEKNSINSIKQCQYKYIFGFKFESQFSEHPSPEGI